MAPTFLIIAGACLAFRSQPASALGQGQLWFGFGRRSGNKNEAQAETADTEVEVKQEDKDEEEQHLGWGKHQPHQKREKRLRAREETEGGQLKKHLNKDHLSAADKMGMKLNLSISGDSVSGVKFNVSKGCSGQDGNLECTLHLHDGNVSWTAAGDVHAHLQDGDTITIKAQSKVGGMPLNMQALMPPLLNLHASCPACGQPCKLNIKKMIPGMDVSKLIKMMPKLTQEKEEKVKHVAGGEVVINTPNCDSPMTMSLNHLTPEELPFAEIGGSLDKLPKLVQGMISNLKLSLSFSISVDRPDGTTVFNIAESGLLGHI